MTKKFIGLVVAVSTVCCVFLGCSDGGKIVLRPEKLPVVPVDFEIPKVQTWELDNGLVVHYRFNDEVPKVQATMYFRGGEHHAASYPAGLTQAVGSQMREGSISGFPPAKLDKHLDDLAASIESGVAGEWATVSFDCLEEDFGEVFSLFSKVVTKPAFNAERLALWKKLQKEGIRRRRDDPSSMATMSFYQLMYGADSVYARRVSNESLRQISRNALLKFHRKFIRPDGAILAISGSLSREKIEEALTNTFVSWTGPSTPLPPLEKVTHQLVPAVYVLERDFSQATVLIGHLGPPRHTKDRYDMAIFNRVFGTGGFSSMLMREIRTRLGLAYSVYGALMPGTVAGIFQINLATRAGEAVTAIKRSIELVEETRTKVPVEEDFGNAKSAVERSFVFKFDDPGFLPNRAAILSLLDYPNDYDQKYLKRIQAVTREGVREVAERWIHPQGLLIVIVGKVSAKEIATAFAGEREVYKLSFDTMPHIGELVQP